MQKLKNITYTYKSAEVNHLQLIGCVIGWKETNQNIKD